MLPRPKGPPLQAEGAGKAIAPYLGFGLPQITTRITPNYHSPPQILGPFGGPLLVLGLENGMENGTNVSKDKLPGKLVEFRD